MPSWTELRGLANRRRTPGYAQQVSCMGKICTHEDDVFNDGFGVLRRATRIITSWSFHGVAGVSNASSVPAVGAIAAARAE